VGDYERPDGTVLHYNIYEPQKLSTPASPPGGTEGEGAYPKFFTDYPVTSSRGGLPPTDTDSWGLASGPITAAHDGYITITNPRTREQCALDMRDKYHPQSTCLATNDSDGDTIPDAVDNCPSVRNKDQANCNAEAENAAIAREARGVARLGDACDPVPCPSALLPLQQTKVGAFVDGDNKGPSVAFTRRIANRIEVSTIPAHAANLLANAGTPVNVANVQTDYRFCQSNTLLQIACDKPSILRDNVLVAGPTAALESPQNKARPWHRMTVTRALPPFGLGDRDHTTDPLTYGVSNVARLWDYTTDYKFWTQPQLGQGLIPAPDPDYLSACRNTGLFGDGTCLRGRIWLHAETPVGADNANGNYGGVYVGVHGADLANYYMDSSPDEAATQTRRGYGNPKSIWLWQTLSDPYRGMAAGLVNVAKTHEALMLAAVGSGAARGIVGFAPGRELETESFASPGLIDAMKGDVARFVSSSEPGRAANLVNDYPAAVLLSHDGTSVVDAVVAERGQLALRSEVQAVFGLADGGGLGSLFGFADPSSTSSGAAVNATASSQGPRARVDFVSVYSAFLGRVFVLGGVEAETGTPSTEAWTYDLAGTGTWRALPADLHNVLAATYVSDDGMLWVLDEVPAPRLRRAQASRGGAAVVRLVRVDPVSGRTAEVATWPRLRNGGRMYVSASADTGVVLATTWVGEQRGRHVGTYAAAQISLERGLTRVKVDAEAQGELVAAPIVDERGVAYMVRQANGEIGVVRAPSRARPPRDDRGDHDHYPDHDPAGPSLEDACGSLF
jgi:hypothetical protein